MQQVYGLSAFDYFKVESKSTMACFCSKVNTHTHTHTHTPTQSLPQALVVALHGLRLLSPAVGAGSHDTADL